MNGSALRIVPAVLLVVSVATLSGCSSQLQTPRPSAAQANSPRVGATPASDATTPAELPCDHPVATTTAPPPYLAELPEPPIAQGAGQDEEEELNDGVKPVLPIDPNAKPADNNSFGQPELPASGATDNAQPDDIVVYRELSVTGKSVAHLAEPNVAVNANNLLITWNSGAARSFDGGATTKFMNPYDLLGSSDEPKVDGGFCCDQLAHYVAAHDMWLWAMQTRPVDVSAHAGGNRIRLMVATGSGDFNTYYDFASKASGLPGDVWYDQPKIGTSDGFLIMSVNAFLPDAQGKKFVASVIYRVSLTNMAAGERPAASCFSTYDPVNGSLFGLVPVRDARDVMYLAAHATNSLLAVWRWPDADTAPRVYGVQEKNAQGNAIGFAYPTDAAGNAAYSCSRTGGSAAANWCLHNDDRISSVFLVNGQIGVAWGAGQSPTSDDVTNRPYPHLVVDLIDEASLPNCLASGCISGHLGLYSKDYAIQVATVAPNAEGDLGMVALLGGGNLKPTCMFYVHHAGSTTYWESSLSADISPNDTLDSRWGDYTGIWPGPTEGAWTASCMTVDGIDPFSTGHVRIATFGRKADSP
jgi:hypothetical protein